MPRTESNINGWPFAEKGFDMCSSHHPHAQGERYLCQYEVTKDNIVPCTAKPTIPCPWNPLHLPGTKGQCHDE